jgi:hypothetical protein
MITIKAPDAPRECIEDPSWMGESGWWYQKSVPIEAGRGGYK